MEGLNWSTGLYEHEIPVDIDEDTLVPIEGVLLYRPWLIPYFDYKIFLDINKTKFSVEEKLGTYLEVVNGS
ncbi:hypothetical protein J14TS5_49990 [Paenibacillus lautus]|nr:hypothetical protein J14TS5_49990 [Paenibacillus lautus]